MGFLKKIFKPIGKLLGAIFKPLKKWLTPDVPGKKAFDIQRSGSNHKIPVVYGTEKVGAIVVDRNVTDAAGGAENEFFHVLAVFCHGEIDAFEEFYFNDVSENDAKWLKDKNSPGGAKWFTKEVRIGSTTQSAVNAVGKLNRFDANNSKYEGLAIAFFTFQQDKDQSIWGGEPQITARIRGKKVYDLRTGLTVYNENPALHLLDYLKSPIYGKALVDADLDLSSFIFVANICDQQEVATVSTLECKTVDGVYSCSGLPSEVVTFSRFSNNNTIDTEVDIFKNMQEIANSFRGFFPDSDGRIKIATEIESSPVVTIDEDSILSSLTINRASKNDRYNRVVVRFKNKLANFEADEVVWPPTDSATYQQWLDEDNGIVLEHTIQADYIKYKALALQLAELSAKISRNIEEIQFTAPSTMMVLDVGDVFALNYASYGFEGREYRVSDIEYREDMFVNIAAELHNDGLYPWADIEYEEFLGGSNLGDPNNMPPPTDLAIAADPTFATSGTLSWNVSNNAFIRRFDVQINLGATVVYRAETLGQSFAIPLFNVGLYSISVRSVSALGTLSQAASISLNLQIPIPPTDIEFNVTYESIEAKPVLAGVGLGTTFEYGIDTASPVGRGFTFTFIGLAHTTLYTVYARTVTALGVSAWFTKEVTTADNASNLLDLIGEDIGASIFDDVVTEVEAELETIVAAATADKLDSAEVQVLIDDSIALVNEGDSEDARIELINSALSVLDEFGNKASFRQVNFALTQEKSVRAAQILQLNASNEAIIERVDLVETNTEGLATAVSQVSGEVNNPETGLSATFGLAQIAKTTADGAASSATLIENQVNSPTNGLSATFTLAGSAKTTADANTSALAGLRVAVAGSNSQSQAELILSATVDKADESFARAFLGVTTVVGGIARINGIVIDGATNTLEFRTDTLRLTDTGGTLQLYWSASRSKWVFSGDIVAATFQTATSGYRAEMSGAGAFPFWYGTGTKNLANASFAVDVAGTVTIRNATVQGAFLSAVGNGNRVEINADSTYLIWAGSGAKTDANGTFWIKANGTGFIKGEFFQGEIIESKLGAVSNGNAIPATATATGHSSAGKPVEVTGQVSVFFRKTGNTAGQAALFTLTLRRDGTNLVVAPFQATGFFEAEDGQTLYTGFVTTSAVDTRTVVEARNYSAILAQTGGATPSTGVIINMTVKTYENKLG